MEFLPIFLSARDRRVVVVGDGQMADAKCRGVVKTSARVTVFTDNPSEQAQHGRDRVISRSVLVFQNRLTLQTLR